jgi:RNA-directed DNA polymerase
LYGYRKGKNSHQAVERALKSAFNNGWAIDIDIKGFFDNIDHELLLKAVGHFCSDPWILMYVRRWLKAEVLQEDGKLVNRLTGTPQGGVISPLLSNIYLHVVFDKWMEKNHPEKPFERYADDMVVHCKTEKQAKFVRQMIDRRMTECKLQLHPEKTKIINLRGITLMPTIVISRKSKSSILEKLRSMKIHKMRTSIEVVSQRLSPIIRGWMNYYCKFWTGHTHNLWHQINLRLNKWVRWEKGLSSRSARRWIKAKYKVNPRLFPHWELVHP